MKSSRLLQAIFCFFAAILVTTATVSYVTQQRYLEASQWVTRSHEALLQLEVIHSDIEDVEAGIQTILFTGEAPDASSFQTAILALPRKLNDLRHTVVDPRLLERLDVLGVEVRSRLLTAQEMQDANLRHLHADPEHAAAIYARQNPVAEIRQLLTAMENDELLILAERRDHAESLRQNTETLLLVLRITSLFGLVIAYFVIKHDYHAILLRETELKHVRTELQGANQEQTKSIAELAAQNEQVESLNRLVELLQRSQHLREALQVLGTHLPEVVDCPAGAVYLLRSSKHELERVVSWGEPAEKAEFFPTDWCWGLRRGRAHVVHDDVTNPICEHIGADDTGLTACIPLAAHGETQGLICLQRATWTNAEAKRHLRFLGTAVEQISLGLANLRLRDALRDQSIRDPLTGLFNRRYIEESLEQEIARATRSAMPVSLLILDLDHFKSMNDTYGHSAGDRLLRELGVILRCRSRTEDVAARYGGEEFLLMLPGMDKIAAVQRAEELRSAIADIQLVDAGIELPAVTASIGVAAFPDHGHSVDDLLRSADKALYRAKHAGRDRVVLVSV